MESRGKEGHIVGGNENGIAERGNGERKRRPLGPVGIELKLLAREEEVDRHDTQVGPFTRNSELMCPCERGGQRGRWKRLMVANVGRNV